MVLLGFSGFVGCTSHSGHLSGGINLYPSWIFLSFFYCMAIQSGRTSQLIHQYSGGSNWIFQFSRASTRAAGRSFWIMALGLATSNVVSSASGVSTGLGWVSLASVMAGEAVTSTGGVPASSSSASDFYPGNGEMVSSTVGLSCVSLTSVMAEEVVESAGGVPVSSSTASGMALPKPLKTSCLLKVVYFPINCLNSIMLITKG